MRKEDRSWREEIEGNVTRWWRIRDERAHQDADPVNPQRVFHELSSRLPDRVMLTADSGSATNWWARHLTLRDGMDAALSGTLATMCPLDASQVLPDFAYAEYARLLGLEGVKVDEPGALGEAWDRVLAADRPAVLEVVTDPEVPPLPPHIRFEQAKEPAGALRQGDPAAARIVKNALKGKLAEFTNR